MAYLRDGGLTLLDGESNTTREVAGVDGANGLAWSANGRWLALRQTAGKESRVVLVEAATGEVRELTGLPGQVIAHAWAPAGSALAVSLVTGSVEGATQPYKGEVWVIDDPAQMEQRFLAATDTPAGFLRWSPDGSRLAWVRTLPFTDPESRSDALEVVEAREGQPVPWAYVAERAGINLAGWWPDGRGLFFWVRPTHCVSCAADGTPLRSVALATREVVDLPVSLLTPAWLAPGPGAHDLILVQGGGRTVWDEKALAHCDVATGACRTLPQPDDAVSLDPALSPDGSQIAFVRAKRRPGEWGFASEEALKEWVGSRTLWLIRPDGTGARQITGAGGAIYSPAWSTDGRRLLYVKDGTLWALDLSTEQAQPVVDLGQPDNLFGFYGQISWWSHRFAWHRPR